ncbi:hypothetical protein [Paenibacillus agri]|uniref:DUF4367 domain-containing protein n=1 Tax=Paenibacillus agri TaxID=2744309 RepID=A0A850EUJ9_9BACL|nr:hypothetical protein [Paenibacillus agri]NUU63540.1 hypothetical protein [Paenibacillus agri]
MKKNMPAAIAAMSMVLLLGAASGAVNAASSFTKQKSQATAPVEQPIKTPLSIQQLIDKENAVKLQPGEIRVMYINHGQSNPDDMLNFNYMPYRYNTISEAAQKLRALTGETLEEPGNLPERYNFQEAVIDPVIPFFLSDDYKKLRDELKAEAVKSGQKVIAKKYKWTSGSATLTFTRRGERICLHSGPAVVLPPGVTYASLPGDKDEDLIINGREAVYTVFGPHHYDLKAELTWSRQDESQDYKLTVNNKSTLTKEQLEEIAASLINP